MLHVERLKELRSSKGLLQRDLAKVLDMERSTYSKYESSVSQPPIDVTVKIAKFFNVTTDYLLGLSDTPTIPSNTEKSDTEELGAALKKLFVDAGKISDDEELTESFKVYATDLVRAAIAFDKARKNNE